LRRNKPAPRKSKPRRALQRSSAALTGITPAEVLEPLLWLLDAVGVSRREVLATVRSFPSVKLPVPVTVVRGELEYWSRILDRWAADTQFIGPDGRPRDLPFFAGDPSFSDLVAIELPGERPAVCRDTLMAIGSIIRLPNGHLRWRERTALAYGAASGVIRADEYLRPLRALLLVLQSNLLRPEVAFQRAVSGFEISKKDMAELNSFVARHGTALLETVDDWLAHRRQETERSGRALQSSVRPYLGLYLSMDIESIRSPRELARHQSGAAIGSTKAKKKARKKRLP
jgi:Family of unknown function (DUF6502)